MSRRSRGRKSSEKLARRTVLLAAVLVIVAVASLAVFFLPSQKDGQPSTSTIGQSVTDKVTPGLLGLFGNYSQMSLKIGSTDSVNGPTFSDFSYAVLGVKVANSITYHLVRFTELDLNVSEIAWFNQQGQVYRVDAPGQGNYTGPSAVTLAESYTDAFSTILHSTNNSTLLSGLQKVGEGNETIGPTQVDVSTYELPAPTSTYLNYTAKIGIIGGTGPKLAVLLYQAFPDGSASLFQVTSVAKA